MVAAIGTQWIDSTLTFYNKKRGERTERSCGGHGKDLNGLRFSVDEIETSITHKTRAKDRIFS